MWASAPTNWVVGAGLDGLGRADVGIGPYELGGWGGGRFGLRPCRLGGLGRADVGIGPCELGGWGGNLPPAVRRFRLWGCAPGGKVMKGQGRGGPVRQLAELLRRHGAEGGLMGGHRILVARPGRPGTGPRRFRRQGGGPGPVGLQGRLHGVIHRVKHLFLAAELDLLLGGVDVHVHGVELGLEVQDAAGELAHHLLVGVGLLQGGHHGAALHIPAVDKEVLIPPGAPAAGGQGHKTGDRHILPGALHRGEAQGQIPAQHSVQGGLELAIAGGEQVLLAVPKEFDAHLRVGQGQPLHHGEAGRPLGGVLLHEFKAGRGVVKQVLHHHGGALGAARLLPVHQYPTLQREGGPQGGIGGAGEQLHPGDGGDGGQRFPPEPQGADGLQVVLGAQLAGGVPEKGDGGLVRVDAATVVGDPDQGHTPVLDLHRQLIRPGVDGVLHQLLHHGGGPLHHLAGSDQVGHVGI